MIMMAVEVKVDVEKRCSVRRVTTYLGNKGGHRVSVSNYFLSTAQ